MNNNNPPDETRPAENESEQPKQTVSFKMMEGKPIVTYMLIGITAAVYLAQAISKWQYGRDLPMLYGAKIGRYITYYHEYWRLVTPVFLHASITHILFNMYALFTIGPSLEKYYGSFDFLRFYLICGFTGNVLSYVVAPNTVSVGASTALFGLIGAQVMFLYKNRRMLRNYQMALRNIGFVLVVNLMLGLGGGIDNWGHMGGLIGGLLIAWLCGPELAFAVKDGGFELVDMVPRSRREISYALVTAFFAALAFAFPAK
ncbi:MAG: rhomboid family intramembrane serine protease [Anaerolineaceae bacterium]|nr:rhomboid family intramembrane serine protease [Anaerolineaceae bacterium]